MSLYLRQNVALSKLLIVNREPCLKYLSSISSNYDGHTRNYASYKPTLFQPKQIQVRHSSFLSPTAFYDSVNSSEPCKFVKQLLIDSHDLTGLPWSVIILASGVLMKFIVSVPCSVAQHHLVAKLELTKIELDGKMKHLQQKVLVQAKKEKWTKSKFLSVFKNEVKEEWSNLVVKNNCHPFKATILFLVQFPFWLLLTLAIRSLATENRLQTPEHPVTALELTLGGPFWCQNLTVPDPTFILPTVNSLALLINNEISVLSKNSDKITQNKLNNFVSKFVPNFLRVFAVGFFFISAASPSGVSLFWATSSLFAVGQSLVLMSPKVRRFLKIPITPSEFDKPFSNMGSKLVEKWRRISPETK